MTCNHSYSGGYCIHCLKKQPIYRNGKEVDVSIKSDSKIAYKSKFEHRKQNSENQYYTQLLIDCLGVSVKDFARYARYVKKLGSGNIHGIIKKIEETDKWCRSTHGKPLKRIGWFINNYVKVNQSKQTK